MSSRSGLTATSFVVLGLLCVRPWTAYELVQQVARGWQDVWPRAARGIYNEPKKLVAYGYAEAAVERTGRRSRTRYEVTDAGRRAFEGWLGAPSAPPAFESEALVRVLFADQGSFAELRAAIVSIRDHAHARSAALLEQGRAYLDHGGPFPERVHLLHLVGGFLAEHHAAMLRWADWALAEIERWDEVTPAWAVRDLEELGRSVAGIFEANLAELSPAPLDLEAADQRDGARTASERRHGD